MLPQLALGKWTFWLMHATKVGTCYWSLKPYGVESTFNENEICNLNMKRHSHCLGYVLVGCWPSCLTTNQPQALESHVSISGNCGCAIIWVMCLEHQWTLTLVCALIHPSEAVGELLSSQGCPWVAWGVDNLAHPSVVPGQEWEGGSRCLQGVNPRGSRPCWQWWEEHLQDMQRGSECKTQGIRNSTTSMAKPCTWGGCRCLPCKWFIARRMVQMYKQMYEIDFILKCYAQWK